MMRRTVCECAAAILVMSLPVWRAVVEAETVDQRWATATAMESQGRYPDAVGVYEEILAEQPESQRAAVQLGAARLQAGQVAEGLAGVEKGIAMNAHGYWAEVGLFHKAQACRKTASASEARKAIQMLAERFPESPWTARAAVLEAELDGGDTQGAEGRLQIELEAKAAYDSAMQLSESSDATTAVARLNDVIKSYPDAGMALRAQEARAHLLIRLNRIPEATADFEELLRSAEGVGPRSRLAEVAWTRLAALYHRAERREEALGLFTRLGAEAADPAIASNAKVQAAGLLFELVQRRKWGGETIPAATWDDLRAKCGAARQAEGASLDEQATADLMIVESFAWQERPQQAVEAATRFLATYDAVGLKKETNLVRFFAGEELQKLGRHAEALALFRQVIAAYPGETHIMPNMDHLPRTYFRVWESLRETGAPPEQVAAAAEALLATFPQSSYAEHVRIVNAQKEAR